MTMLLLKRQNVPLDRDVIFLAESGEEGTSNVGIGYMVAEHFPEIDAEYCLAEGGDAIRERGEVRYATVQDDRRRSCAASSSSRTASPATARCRSSRTPIVPPRRRRRDGRRHGSPRSGFNETTGTYFRRLAMLAPPEQAKYYRDVLSPDPKVAGAADDWLFEHEPRHSSMLRTSVSPNIFTGGYRSNVIPSEAKATLDVRMLPDEDADEAPRAGQEGHQRSGGRRAVHRRRRQPSADRRRRALDSELFKTVEAAVTTRLQRAARCRR